jgi:hypothetical protein
MRETITHSCLTTLQRSKCKSSIGSYRKMISSSSIRKRRERSNLRRRVAVEGKLKGIYMRRQDRIQLKGRKGR